MNDQRVISLLTSPEALGVTEEQMTEAVHVAAAIRGGASLVHGVQMKNIVKKLEF